MTENASQTMYAGDATIHHRPRSAGREMVPTRMSLNLTSMIDVVFLLLIYFVVTASFTPGEGILTAKLPQGTGTANPLKLPPQPLNIQVSPVGMSGYRIGIEGHGAARDFRDLHDQLVQLQYDESRNRVLGTHRPDDPVIIKPQRRVRWQHVVNTFNAAMRARYTNISFAQAQ